MTTVAETYVPAHPNNQPFARSDPRNVARWWWTTDHILLATTAALILIGVGLSFASSPAAAQRMNVGDPLHFAVRQCAFAAGAAVLVVLTSLLSPKGVRRLSAFVYVGAIAVMAALPILGHEAKGAARWIQLGGFSLQPSEFMKPALIVLASWMFAEAQKGKGVPGVTIAFVLYGLAVTLLLLQPDFGQTILITCAFLAAFFIAGVPLKWIAGLGGLALTGAVGCYFMFDHVASRVQRFLSPETTDNHQVERAGEAILAGGLFGRGPGEGVMKRSVPDLHTDFIYSVGAEEYGLVFSLLLIVLFAVLVLRGLYKSMKLSDPYEQVAAAGLFVMIGLQALINVAVNLHLIPTKGMTLPFISYGGSSVLAMGLTVGMAIALTRRRPGAYGAAATRSGEWA